MAVETNGYISRGNMTVILSAAGLVMIAFGGFITFQNGATDRRIDNVREDVKGIQDKYLRKDEHEEFKLRIDKDLTRIGERIEVVNAKIVPRQEVDAKAISVDSTLKLLSERLNEIRNIAGANSTVPLRDEMTRIQVEISDLRKLLLDRQAKP